VAGLTRYRRLRAIVGSVLLTSTMLIVGAAPAAAATDIVAYLDGDQVVPGPGDPTGLAYVRVQFDTDQGVVCTTWGLIDIQPTAAQIHGGVEGESGAAVVDLPLDNGCSPDGLDTGVLQAIIDDLDSYYVEVQTEGFPEGAVRGQLGTEEVTDLFFVHYACPVAIQSAADLDAAGGTSACQVAIDESDLGPTPDGQPYVPEPILFNVKLALKDAAGDTFSKLTPEGGGTCDETSCTPPGYVYRFVDDLRSTTNMLAGPTTIDINSDPEVYRLALVRVTDEADAPIQSNLDGIDNVLQLDTSGTDQVAVRAFYFVGDDPNPVPPGATVPPTSTDAVSQPGATTTGAGAIALLILVVCAALIPARVLVRRS
jgi:hypothetical protein